MTDPRKPATRLYADEPPYYNASPPATFLEAAAELRAALVTFVCPLMWPAAQMLAALTRRTLTRDQYESDLAACHDCRRIGPGQFAPRPIPTEARPIESQEGDQ